MGGIRRRARRVKNIGMAALVHDGQIAAPLAGSIAPGTHAAPRPSRLGNVKYAFCPRLASHVRSPRQSAVANLGHAALACRRSIACPPNILTPAFDVALSGHDVEIDAIANQRRAAVVRQHDRSVLDRGGR
mgnify:CR=1 FL=1